MLEKVRIKDIYDVNDTIVSRQGRGVHLVLWLITHLIRFRAIMPIWTLFNHSNLPARLRALTANDSMLALGD